MAGTFAPLTKEVVDDFRSKLVKTATLAIAAVESLDRQRLNSQHAFYEDPKA